MRPRIRLQSGRSSRAALRARGDMSERTKSAPCVNGFSVPCEGHDCAGCPGWDRQYSSDDDCNDDETKRCKTCNEDDVSPSIYVSVSDSSLEERGVGGETKPPPSEAEAEFVAHFRAFNGKREAQRWETLVEAIGMTRAQEIAAWAERKEIHMVNRGGLLDSLETAARKWIDAPSGKTSFLEQLKVA